MLPCTAGKNAVKISHLSHIMLRDLCVHRPQIVAFRESDFRHFRTEQAFLVSETQPVPFCNLSARRTFTFGVPASCLYLHLLPTAFPARACCSLYWARRLVPLAVHCRRWRKLRTRGPCFARVARRRVVLFHCARKVQVRVRGLVVILRQVHAKEPFMLQGKWGPFERQTPFQRAIEHRVQDIRVQQGLCQR